MSQTNCNQATANNKKTYHSPQLRKFGKVSDLTLTNQTFIGSDGGSGLNQYAS